MGTYLNPGNAGFASIRRDQYVDKSGMIGLVNRAIGTPGKLICVSRPRRFGKSFAAKMLCAYYDESCDSSALFDDLAIRQDDTYAGYRNSFNVIYIDVSGFISKIRSAGGELGSIVPMITGSVVSELKETFPFLVGRDTGALSDALMAVTEKSGDHFIFIIDEWDAVFREAAARKDVQDAYMNFLRDLFKNGNVTDTAIAAAYMTGILPIKKYGHQSAISDFREYSMTDPAEYAPYVGFTEEEVESLLEENGAGVPAPGGSCRNDQDRWTKSTLRFDDLRTWYDGYSFPGEPAVYNPNSVMMAVRHGYCDSFWTRTETYESLRTYINADFDGLQTALVQLLGGADFPVNINTFQNDITTFHNKDDVLTLLIHLGYLAYDVHNKTVRVPNLEIRKEFAETLAMSSHQETARLIRESDQLIADTIDGNEAAVAAAMDKAHESGTAPLFYNNEQALRAVVKAAYISAVNDYQTIEELPSGRGYADVVFIPKRDSSKPAMLVELKWNRSVAAAIDQIHRQHYPSVLKGLAGDLLLVGITYDTKTREHSCRIERVGIND